MRPGAHGANWKRQRDSTLSRGRKIWKRCRGCRKRAVRGARSEVLIVDPKVQLDGASIRVETPCARKKPVPGNYVGNLRRINGAYRQVNVLVTARCPMIRLRPW